MSTEIQNQSSESVSPAADSAEREPNTRKVKLRRIMHQVQMLGDDNKPVLDDKQQPVMIDEPAVMLTQASVMNAIGGYDHIILDAAQNEFQFAVGDAAYLLREHADALEAVPDAPTKLKSTK